MSKVFQFKSDVQSGDDGSTGGPIMRLSGNVKNSWEDGDNHGNANALIFTPSDFVGHTRGRPAAPLLTGITLGQPPAAEVGCVITNSSGPGTPFIGASKVIPKGFRLIEQVEVVSVGLQNGVAPVWAGINARLVLTTNQTPAGDVVTLGQGLFPGPSWSNGVLEIPFSTNNFPSATGDGLTVVSAIIQLTGDMSPSDGLCALRIGMERI